MATTEEDYQQYLRNLKRAKLPDIAVQRGKIANSSSKKRSKYLNTPVNDPIHGYFQSTGEWRRWYNLLTLQDAGQITDLQRQVKFDNLARIIVILNERSVETEPGMSVVSGEIHTIKVISWTIDYTYKEGVENIAEDFKSHGTKTKRFEMQAAAFRLKYPEWELRISDSTWLN